MRTIKINDKEYNYVLDLSAIERIEEDLDRGIFSIVSDFQDTNKVRMSTLKIFFFHALKSGDKDFKLTKEDVSQLISEFGMLKFITEVLPKLVGELVPEDVKKKQTGFKEQVKNLKKKPISQN